MKAWYKKNKNILIIFGFTTLITFLFTMLEIHLIMSNMQDLEIYATTREMSDSLKFVGIMGLINVAILTVWTFIFIFIILKVIFPNKRSVKNFLFLDELRFLKDIPSEIRREVNKR
ncbi:hypothetical protein M4D76_16260 [Peribacillus frigoritolerans]|uniref:hypothetical protein n=1 Tax=Peribacillus TaxID=2675229 RepID=UPI0021A48F33|nr:hypothetical protein [Peribacillus frigoritolerans]MCT1389850.1 hypothetical protein [Peribacillus frigoritolerans]